MYCFEDLDIRNLIQLDKDGYTAFFYEDCFLGEWIGNVNVYKGEQYIYHATVCKTLTQEDLVGHIEYAKKIKEVKLK